LLLRKVRNLAFDRGRGEAFPVRVSLVHGTMVLWYS
jgi:hypothetical protein